MKKITAVVLALIAILTMFCACNKAEETEKTTETTAVITEFSSGDYVYKKLEDGTAKIILYTGTEEARVLEIPHRLDGLNVTVIGEGAFKDVQNIYNVKFPRYLTTIEAHAFEGSSIKNAIMDSSKVAYIGEYAFAECPNLVQVDFSMVTETVADKAFYLSSAIRVVTFRNDIAGINPAQAFDTGSSDIQKINCVTNDQEPFNCAMSLANAKGFPVENISMIRIPE